MYHYFANKHEILLELLLRTVSPSVRFATKLNRRPESPEERLWALCSYDAHLLAEGDLNIGLMLLLPEAANPEMSEFRAERDRLIAVYRNLIADCPSVTESDAHDFTTMIVALIESVVLIRREDPDVDATAIANRIADTALRIIGVSSSALRTIRSAGALLRDDVVAEAPRSDGPWKSAVANRPA